MTRYLVAGNGYSIQQYEIECVKKIVGLKMINHFFFELDVTLG
jgi:hypothetical protein